MSRYDGSIRIDTRLNSNNFNSGLRSMTASLKKFALAVGVAFSVKAIIDFGKAGVKAAEELQNAMMGLQSVVEGQGRSFSKAKKFIDEYVSDGLVSATQATTAYKNLALRGYSDEQIQQTMVALKDAAAFGRQSSYTLGEAVVSAAEGLKNENSILVDNAGVTKNVAKMWEDYAKSIGTNTKNLTQQQKIQAEVNGILEETKFQTGDAAKIANSYSGQVLQLSYSMNNLKVAVGNMLMPILQKIIPHIKSVVDWFTRLANAAAQVSAILFGKAVKVNTGVADSASSASDSLSGMADAEKKAGDAAEKAGKQAKSALAAFDDLNVLSNDSGSGSSGGGVSTPEAGGGIETVEPETITEDLDAGMVGKVERLRELLEPTTEACRRLKQELDRLGEFSGQALSDFYNNCLVPIGQWVLGEGLPRFIDAITLMLQNIDWQTLNDALNTLWEALTPFAINIGEGLLWFFENVITPLVTWAMDNIVPLAIEGIAAALEILNGIVEALKPTGQWLWENFLKPIAEWTGGIIVTVLEDIVAVLQDLGTWINEHQTAVQGIATALLAFWVAWNLVNAAAKAWNAIILIWNSIGVIASVVAGAFGTAMTILTSPIFLVSAAIAALIAIVVLLGTHWDEVKEKVSTACGIIKDKFEGVKTSIGETMDGIKTTISEKWGNIKQWFSENVAPKFKKEFWIEKFSAIKEAARAIFNGIIGIVENAINGIVDKLNTISFEIPDDIPLVGGLGFDFDLNRVSIPRLATGAVIPPNQEFLAVLGDQKSGRNLEAPEGLIRQIIREELSGLQGGGDINIEFTGNLAQLARVLNPVITKEQKRKGGTLQMGGAF